MQYRKYELTESDKEDISYAADRTAVGPLSSCGTSVTDGSKRDTKLASYIEVGRTTWSSGHSV